MRLAARSMVTCTLLLGGSAAHAQVNLPPPPPPPLGSEQPNTTPPKANDSGTSTRRRPSSGSGSSSRDSSRDTTPARASPSDDSYEAPRYYGGRSFSVRFNPLALVIGRASADAEWLFMPHHALVASPHLTLKQNRSTLPARAMGFAGPDASGVGVELGYHYWLTGVSEPEGIFLGPSLLLDTTKPAPNADRVTAYGLAFDVGYQVIIGSGFTMQAGGGLLAITAKDLSTTFSPRLLFGIGWSF